MRVGLISDTHGLLRPEAVAFLEGSDMILHAGDICDASVLEALRSIAPTVAVRGNNDRGQWADELRLHETIEIGGIRIHMVHDIADFENDSTAAQVDVVVTGHSHRPTIDQREGILFINPGSAGPRRFKLPISAAELVIEDGVAAPLLMNLLAI